MAFKEGVATASLRPGAWPLGAWLCVALPFQGAPSSGQCPVSVWAGEGAESREQGVPGGLLCCEAPSLQAEMPPGQVSVWVVLFSWGAAWAGSLLRARARVCVCVCVCV